MGWDNRPNSFLFPYTKTHSRRIRYLYKKKKEKKMKETIQALKKLRGFSRSVILELGYIFWAPLKSMEHWFNIGLRENPSIKFLH